MKNQLRQKIKQLRREMPAHEIFHKSHRASQIFLSTDIYKNARQIMLYSRLGNETDTSEIINAAFADGKRLVFPVTERTTGIITPFYADKNTVFEKGNFSVSEPVGTQVADTSKTDVIIVPGIAFDKSGNRIGYGKGCYDKFLKTSNAIKIGFCYDFQICDYIPCDKHDIKMDFLITENEIIEISPKTI